ncbi:FGGY-family carbohydrate kinase [Thiomicrorhabdus sp. ZW0627]|uniref:FGGY-family carbohydrate kinase n=1 Tax=Thiomicrorhabdus sp. ZW0627 TaxID=3039774 RepID=UPI002436A7D2|nr:FGGY-family carbohydrate kinase [Thiomicrorhabdus sp. ZW0627]MDG6772956.1 FGGY-family carbohydrate kinase [Thiomicrorhabdus sp. ZW0627]
MVLNPHNLFSKELILGLDIGTSGIRGSIVSLDRSVMGASSEKHSHCELFSAQVGMPMPDRNCASRRSAQNPLVWIEALKRLFAKLSESPYWQDIGHIVADATSSTVMLCDGDGNPLTEALMYDDQQAQNEAKLVAERARKIGVETGALGASSTLAKVMFLLQKSELAKTDNSEVSICHQIDFINHYLTGSVGLTDENNALKLGYDLLAEAWPDWVVRLLEQTAHSKQLNVLLPKVNRPGEFLQEIDHEVAQRFGLSRQVRVYLGTTDSIAGFLASGASSPGDGVTSLGSTIALKLLSEKPIFNAEFGIYSHRLGNSWLVGGASNAGGAVLLSYFSLDEIKDLVAYLEDHHAAKRLEEFYTDRFYPILHPGERFPISDTRMQPRLPSPEPKENSSTEEKAAFLLGLLQGLCHVEELGYNRLQQMGASRLQRVFSVGGGTQNAFWQALRAVYLPVEHKKPLSLDASFGVTRLIK